MRLQTIIKAITMVAAALHSLQRGTVSLKLTGQRRLHQLTTRAVQGSWRIFLVLMKTARHK
jgi:hypothetical protein